MWVGGPLNIQPTLYTVIDPMILGVKITFYSNILQHMGDKANLEQIKNLGKMVKSMASTTCNNLIILWFD